MNTRFYVVKHAAGDKVEEFLVDAPSRQTAERHVAKKFINAQVASARTVGLMMAAGTKIEIANEAPAEQSEPPVDTPASEDVGTHIQEGGRRRRRA